MLKCIKMFSKRLNQLRLVCRIINICKLFFIIFKWKRKYEQYCIVIKGFVIYLLFRVVLNFCKNHHTSQQASSCPSQKIECFLIFVKLVALLQLRILFTNLPSKTGVFFTLDLAGIQGNMDSCILNPIVAASTIGFKILPSSLRSMRSNTGRAHIRALSLLIRLGLPLRQSFQNWKKTSVFVQKITRYSFDNLDIFSFFVGYVILLMLANFLRFNHQDTTFSLSLLVILS